MKAIFTVIVLFAFSCFKIVAQSVYDRAKDFVFTIYLYDSEEGIRYDLEHNTSNHAVRMGSGILLDNDGTIITCAHLVEAENKILVVNNYNKFYPVKEVLSHDECNDVIFLKTDYLLPKRIAISEKDTFLVGHHVCLISSGGNLRGSYNPGIISGPMRPSKCGIDRLQHNILTIDGDSGGALIDETTGDLIAMQVQKKEGESGRSIAIPISKLFKSLKVVLSGKNFETPLNLVERLKPSLAPEITTKTVQDTIAAFNQLLEFVKQIKPANQTLISNIYVQKGVYFFEHADYASAMEMAQIGQDINLKNGNVYILMANINIALDQLNLAEECGKNAIKYSPENASAFLILSKVEGMLAAIEPENSIKAKRFLKRASSHAKKAEKYKKPMLLRDSKMIYLLQ